MEEILNKMDEMLELENEKDSLNNKETQIQEMTNNIEEAYREKSRLTDNMLKDLKQEEIEQQEVKLEAIKNEAENDKENFKTEFQAKKSDLMNAIKQEKEKYMRQSEIDALNKELADDEKKKEAYQKVADNAKMTIDKIKQEMQNGDFKNIHLLKNAQTEYDANMLKVESLENELSDRKQTIAEYKAVEQYKDEYSDLLHLEMRMGAINSDNFIDAIRKDEAYGIHNIDKNNIIDEDIIIDKNIIKLDEDEQELKFDSTEDELEEDSFAKFLREHEDYTFGEVYNMFKKEKNNMNNNDLDNDRDNEMPHNEEELKNNQNFERMKIYDIPPFNKQKEPKIDPEIIMDKLEKKKIEVHISEKDKKVLAVYTGEKTGRITEKESELYTWRDLAEKIELYDKTGLKDICKEVAGGKIKGLLLRRKINPSIVEILKEDKDILKEYVTAINDRKELPFELTHDLEGLNPVKKFIKQRSSMLKREEQCGAKILNKLFNKNNTLEEAKDNLYRIAIKDNNYEDDLFDDLFKETKEVEQLNERKYKHASPKDKKALQEEMKRLKIENQDNHIEKNAIQKVQLSNEENEKNQEAER